MNADQLPFTIRATYNLHFILEHFLGYKNFTRFCGFSNQKLNVKIEKLLSDKIDSYVPHKPLFRESNKAEKSSDAVILLRGLAAEWPATKKWSLPFFAENYGDREIILSDLKGTIDPQNPQSFERLRMNAYVKQIDEGTLKYLKLSNLVQQEKSLQNDLDLISLTQFLLPGSFGETFYMFIGGKGTITPLHNEISNNIYVQISGQKKWILYPPTDNLLLNPRTERRQYCFSNLNPYNIHDPQYPLQKYARKIEIVLNPGDVLRIPPFYWHYIENMSNSISVSYKFINLPSAYHSSSLFLALFFLSTKPWLLKSFFINRFQKDDYLLTKEDKRL